MTVFAAEMEGKYVLKISVENSQLIKGHPFSNLEIFEPSNSNIVLFEETQYYLFRNTKVDLFVDFNSRVFRKNLK